MNHCALAVLIALLWPLQTALAESPANRSELAYDARLSTYPYEFEVQYFDIESQRQPLQMAYSYLAGSEGKPVVVLLHGKNFNGDYWAPTARFLNQLGYGVLIPDQVGFGKSSKPEHYQFSFPALATHTRNLMTSLEIDRAVVMGHSMGGMLASRFALMYPQTVRQLILVNPIGLENYLEHVEYKDTDFFYRFEMSKTPEGIQRYQQANYYAGNWNETYAALTHFMIGQLQGKDKSQVAWVNALTYDMIFTQPVITEFDRLSVPVSLIIGTRDRTGPGRNWQRQDSSYELGRYDRLGRSAAGLIPEATLYELDELGHLPQVEDFERFKNVLKTALSES